jgi:glycosyltransferase involved in cell wall biosynthesis
MSFFSIIIPTYNRAHLVSKAIESVIAQTFADWELIVIDDGSVDSTSEIVRPYLKDYRVKYHFQNNQERSAARMNGVALSSGLFICFLDSDDYYLPNHLEVLNKTIAEKNEQIGLYYTFAIKCKADGTEELQVISDLSALTVMQQIREDSICTNGISIHREIFRHFQYDKRLTIGEDSHLYYRIATRYPVFRIAAHSHVYFFHESNSVNDKNRIRNLNSFILYLHDLISDERIRAQFEINYNEKRLSDNYRWIAFEYAKKGNRIKALKSIANSWRWAPEFTSIKEKIRLVLYLLNLKVSRKKLFKRSG